MSPPSFTYLYITILDGNFLDQYPGYAGSLTVRGICSRSVNYFQGLKLFEDPVYCSCTTRDSAGDFIYRYPGITQLCINTATDHPKHSLLHRREAGIHPDSSGVFAISFDCCCHFVDQIYRAFRSSTNKKPGHYSPTLFPYLLIIIST